MSNFKAKLNSAIKLLRLSDLIQSENHFPKKPIDIASICREKSYTETWKFLLSESYFRILLKDYSFFMFYYVKNDRLKEESSISMSYYGCPYDFITLEDYIVENYGEEYLSFKYDPDIKQEYELELDDSPVLEYPVTFRYDFSPELYESGRHPASHLHIGFENEIRIGCYRILDPLSFTAFVIRQHYPEIWKHTVLKSCVEIFQSSIRNSLPLVSESYFSEHDKLEMYLD